MGAAQLRCRFSRTCFPVWRSPWSAPAPSRSTRGASAGVRSVFRTEAAHDRVARGTRVVALLMSATGGRGHRRDHDFRCRYTMVSGIMPTRALPFLPLLLAIVGLPLAFGLVPPNGVYGIRTARTLGSERIWYSANASAGLTAVVLGVAGTIFIGFLAGRVFVSDRAKVVAAVGTTVFVATAMAVAGLVRA
jgi:hypothetical protein